ncbi:hypothetical protein EV383_4829 [Pseudonocardia sediminis]|uniref:Oligosaccharide repeat unit polymerase n=1 Tax=Pseudonocardia sediminis TaxID=1397368 RepID=A0A4Q7V0C2_PSEST|nr:hypothetical protein [Pseudonocardia sediminis]RZT87897.1 hypothetical protein EV383_4829 [Pseudonocardia sediminis]
MTLAETSSPAPVAPRLTGTQFVVPLFCATALLAVPSGLFFLPVLDSGRAHLGLSTVLFGAGFLYTAGRLASLMWSGRAQWAALGFWIFTYSWVAVAGLTQDLARSNPLGVTFTLDEAQRQGLLVLLGIVAFDVAHRAAGARGGDVRSGAARFGVLLGRVVDPRRTLVLGWFAVVTGPLFVALLGGPSVLLSSRQAVFDELSQSGLYSSSTNATGGSLSTVANCLPFVALLVLGRLMADDRQVRARTSTWVLLVLLVGLNVVVNNPISNARYWAFAVILGLLYAWRGSARPLFRAAFVTAFALGALTVFPYLDAFRYDSATLAANPGAGTYDRPVDYILAKTDYGSITDIGIAVRFGDSQGPQWGRQILGAATFWVPRSLWTDKPDNTAFLLADEVGFANRNIDSPLWAEGYVDLGWAGAAALLAAAGAACRRLDDAFELTRAGPTAAVPLAAVLVPAVAAYEFILVRGSLLQAMAKIAVMLVLLVLVTTRPDGWREEG